MGKLRVFEVLIMMVESDNVSSLSDAITDNEYNRCLLLKILHHVRVILEKYKNHEEFFV